MYTGRWLTLATLAPAVSGCGRALEWSDSQGRPVEDDTVPSTTTEGASATTQSTAASGGTGETGAQTTTSAAASTTTASTAPADIPDLAVFRGDSPDILARAAVERLGGMQRFVKPDAKVVVKPNVLVGRPPEYAVTTNPLVISAIIGMCLEAGAREVVVLDYSMASPRGAFKEAELTPAVEQAGGKLKYLSNRDFERIEIPEGTAITSWPLVVDALEADTLINVPIAKTHGRAGLTMAMKNLMGLMGDPRGEIHIDLPQKVTDVNTVIKPHLVILDAYRVLVRNGPTGGSLDDVRMPKTVVAGTSQVAIDAYGTTIMGWQPADLPTLVEAHARGLGEMDLAAYDIFEGTA